MEARALGAIVKIGLGMRETRGLNDTQDLRPAVGTSRQLVVLYRLRDLEPAAALRAALLWFDSLVDVERHLLRGELRL